MAKHVPKLDKLIEQVYTKFYVLGPDFKIMYTFFTHFRHPLH